MSREELRLTGSGGQGVILASIILSDIALETCLNDAQSQAYGPEARGGSCKAEVVISNKKINYTKVMNPTFLLALTQASLNEFTKTIDENCILVYDDTLELPKNIKYKKAYSYPILNTALQKIGKGFVANIIAVGLICQILKLANFDKAKDVVSRYIPKGTEELNFKALEEGFKLYN